MKSFKESRNLRFFVVFIPVFALIMWLYRRFVNVDSFWLEVAVVGIGCGLVCTLIQMAINSRINKK